MSAWTDWRNPTHIYESCESDCVNLKSADNYSINANTYASSEPSGTNKIAAVQSLLLATFWRKETIFVQSTSGMSSRQPNELEYNIREALGWVLLRVGVWNSRIPQDLEESIIALKLLLTKRLSSHSLVSRTNSFNNEPIRSSCRPTWVLSCLRGVVVTLCLEGVVSVFQKDRGRAEACSSEEMTTRLLRPGGVENWTSFGM